ncbi:hypothetical protein AAA799E16_02058, partial [Marine Group I thaumarchaeote SCGC AAA799-E16]
FVEVPDVILDAEPIFSWGQFNEWAGYSSSSISDDKFLNHLEIEGDSIPKWFKNNNAKWVKDGLISQDVFVDALNNLSERGLL